MSDHMTKMYDSALALAGDGAKYAEPPAIDQKALDAAIATTPFGDAARTAMGNAIRAYLAALGAQPVPVALGEWRDEITHPNNRLLFRRMVEKAGINLTADDIASALKKVASLAPAQAVPGDMVEDTLRKVRSMLEVEYHDDGRIACVAHESGGLRQMVALLDAALAGQVSPSDKKGC